MARAILVANSRGGCGKTTIATTLAATAKFLKKIDDLKPIRSNKKPVVFVGNRIRARTRSTRELEAFLASTGHAVGTLVADRALYTDGAYSGVSIFDREGARARAAQAEWSPLITFVETT